MKSHPVQPEFSAPSAMPTRPPSSSSETFQAQITFYAHTAVNSEGRPLGVEAWQLLRTHLQNVGNFARGFARPVQLETEATIAGLLHDLGKYAERFQARLHNPSEIHGVNHWAAGAACAITQRFWAVAFAVDGHHAGIPALRGHRSLEQTRTQFSDAKLREEFTRCSESLAELLARLEADALALPELPQRGVSDHFAETLRIRLLFSCLVDADFLDTEHHFSPARKEFRQPVDLAAGQALRILQEFLAEKPTIGSVNATRRELLSDCVSAAEMPPGLFTLTAPTGSGKTLASLAFALRHIAFHNANLPANDPKRFQHIIVVIPYTSIIEQTAGIFRELFESEFGPDYVLEHHSAAAIPNLSTDASADSEGDHAMRVRLATENWASPLVVTTSAQFFESLFARRPSTCRKLHNIGRSVILFDEVQTLPPRLVPSLLSSVGLLTQEPYGVSAVFMTATQPAFAAAKKALPYGWEPREISSQPSAMAETFRRTHIELPKPGEHISWKEIAAKLADLPQALCVVNTTRDARQLYRLLPATNRFHLSARMCPAHRLAKLGEIRERLRPSINAPCLLVSTQLIEAGVDVDFPIAFRAFGPLDSIIQTAGRCNREGRQAEPAPVIVFRPLGGGTPRGAYKIAAAKTEEFLARYPDAQDRMHQPEFYSAYFRELYALLGPQSAKDDPVFSACEEYDFPKAAEECRLVDEETRRVLVKWREGEGERLAEKLEREKYLTRDECRLAQLHSINLYESEFQSALARGIVYQPAKDWDFFVWNSQYDDDLGACHADNADLIC